jgi:DNA repair photolyase
MQPRSNPPNPWARVHVEREHPEGWDPDWVGAPPSDPLLVYEEEARSLIVENDSPDVGFRFGVNPYRGCQHRPLHQHLGFGAGTDFERRIVVKVNAPEVLRRELARPSWGGDELAFSGATDCYQPLEASYRLTRRCLEACRDARNPVGIVTKGVLVQRDVALLAELHARAGVRVHVSVPFADPEVSRALEPAPASPERRFAAMKRLADAGIPVGLSLAPVVPGLNDADLPELLERARDAGARTAFLTLLRLPTEVLPVFFGRLAAALPGRVAKVRSQLLDVRGGALDEARANLPGWDAKLPSSRAIGGPELIAHLRGEIGLDEATEAAILASRQYAKRQRTWFRSNMKAWRQLSLP